MTPQPPPATPESGAPLPLARVENEAAFTPVWIVPLLALLLAAVLAWQAWGQRGVPLTLQFEDAHGLKAGDVLRFRGMVAGEVRHVDLDPRLGSVSVRLALDPDARELARVGSRFWIVRPQLGLAGLTGLDTLIGDRYLAVLPGSGPAHDEFVGLEQPPVDDALRPGLDIVLEGEGRGSLVPGAPVTYRRLRVGSVLSVRLAGDARTVEVPVRIQQPYADLVRAGTRFWTTGGVDVELGLSGLTIQVDTLASVLQGGVALATPPERAAGAAVATGHRFALAARPEPEWLEWRPEVAIGHSLLPSGSPMPQPERATLAWTEGRFWTGTETREGWVLPLAGALLGPEDLFRPSPNAHADSASLAIAGQSLSLPEQPSPVGPGLALLVLSVPGLEAWPAERQRAPSGPEDCVLVADQGNPPLALAPGRFHAAEDGWRIDRAIPLDARWHGAPVLARKDGRLIGLLLVDEDQGARVVPLPGPLP